LTGAARAPAPALPRCVTRGGLLEGFDRRAQRAFVVLREVLGVFDALDEVSVAGLQVVVQALLERQHLLDVESSR
jgi:hypothetical protein